MSQDELEALRDWYRGRLRRRFDELEAGLAALAAGSPEAEESLRRAAHSLKGSGSTYGFPAITQAASAAEQAPREQLVASLRDLQRVLRAVAEGAPVPARGAARAPSAMAAEAAAATTPASPAPAADASSGASGPPPTALLVAGDEGVPRTLSPGLVEAGLAVGWAPDAGHARRYLASTRPQVILLVPPLADGCADALALEWSQDPRLRDVPLVVHPMPTAEPEVVVQRLLGRASGPQPAPAARPTRRVLVIEDDLLVREFLDALLVKEGFEVTSRATGKEALRTLDAGVPDLVVLDLQLLGTMDGLEVLAQLRARGDTAETRVLVVTARTGEDVAARCLEAGADAVLAKPFSPPDLRARVHQLLTP